MNLLLFKFGTDNTMQQVNSLLQIDRQSITFKDKTI